MTKSNVEASLISHVFCNIAYVVLFRAEISQLSRNQQIVINTKLKFLSVTYISCLVPLPEEYGASLSCNTAGS